MLNLEVWDFELYLVLDGGVDGLDVYCVIFDEVCNLVKLGGLVVFEIGYDQGEVVSGLLQVYGFSGIVLIQDFVGYDCVVLGVLL